MKFRDSQTPPPKDNTINADIDADMDSDEILAPRIALGSSSDKPDNDNDNDMEIDIENFNHASGSGTNNLNIPGSQSDNNTLPDLYDIDTQMQNDNAVSDNIVSDFDAPSDPDPDVQMQENSSGFDDASSQSQDGGNFFDSRKHNNIVDFSDQELTDSDDLDSDSEPFQRKYTGSDSSGYSGRKKNFSREFELWKKFDETHEQRAEATEEEMLQTLEDVLNAEDYAEMWEKRKYFAI